MGSTVESANILVVGGGVFGVTGALALAGRGHRVRLMQPGCAVDPRAASTDISKVVRLDYGSDAVYTALMERALEGWARWNAQWGTALFWRTGLLVLASDLAEGGFEHESAALLESRGHHIERLTTPELLARFGAWAQDTALHGYLSPEGGWTDSGRVVAQLHEDAVAAGVERIDARLASLSEGDDRVRGVVGTDGTTYDADIVVLATGAWTPTLVPDLGDRMWAVAQPLFHFRPTDPAAFSTPHFAPWTADIAQTGFYGFCAHEEGVVKVANHGPGLRVHPSAPGEPGESTEIRFRTFLERTLPALADAPITYRRHCLYCDTWDGDFYIDHHPDLTGVVVATGGSGHAFKFAPVLGDLIADAVERRDNPVLARFAWRDPGGAKSEGARRR